MSDPAVVEWLESLHGPGVIFDVPKFNVLSWVPKFEGHPIGSWILHPEVVECFQEYDFHVDITYTPMRAGFWYPSDYKAEAALFKLKWG